MKTSKYWTINELDSFNTGNSVTNKITMMIQCESTEESHNLGFLLIHVPTLCQGNVVSELIVKLHQNNRCLKEEEGWNIEKRLYGGIEKK